MHVFNTPPGWPPMPAGWWPEPGWRPSSDWPPPPPGWNFSVPTNLRMSPLDLSRDIDLGPVSQLRMSRLGEVTEAAADAIAWRVCSMAAETNILPMTAYLRFRDEADSALLEARRRIYDSLLDDGLRWVNSLPRDSTARGAAAGLVRAIHDSKESFLERSRRRLRLVLQAAGPPSSAEPPPQQTESTPRGQAQQAPQRSPSSSRPVPSKVEGHRPRTHALIGLGILVLLLVVGAPVASTISSTSNGTKPAGTHAPLTSAGPFVDAGYSMYAGRPEDACGQVVKRNVTSGSTVFYSTTTTSTAGGLRRWVIEGFARVRPDGQKNLSFTCGVTESNKAGQWDVTLYVLP